MQKPLLANALTWGSTHNSSHVPRSRATSSNIAYLFFPTRMQSRCCVYNIFLSCTVLSALVASKPCVLLIPIERACVGTTLICPIYLYFISWLSVSSAPRISHLSYIYLTAKPAHMGVSVTAWTTGTSTCACVCLSVCKVV